MSFMLALATSIMGLACILIAKSKNSEYDKPASLRYVGGIGTIIAATLILWWIYYANLPSLVWPFFGMMGLFVVTLWFVSAIFLKSRLLIGFYVFMSILHLLNLYYVYIYYNVIYVNKPSILFNEPLYNFLNKNFTNLSFSDSLKRSWRRP